jgi:hypothetical protein
MKVQNRISWILTDEAVDEVDLAVALSNELRRLSMVDGS